MTESPRVNKLPAVNWEEKKLTVLLDAASIAIKRARYVFIIINIGAILIFSAEFNALLPWIRWPISRTTTPEDVQKTLREVLFKDLNVFAVPLLGIRVSVADLTIIGSVAMVVLAIWFFYCVRRENLVVSDIAKFANTTADPEKRSYLYYGIAHYFVYTTAPEKKKEKDRQKERPAGEQDGSETTARQVVRVLFYVPFWAPLLIVASDVLSLIMSPKVAPHAPFTLWSLFESKLEAAEAITRMTIAVLLSLVAWYQCASAYRWDKGTRNLVEALRKRVENDERTQRAANDAETKSVTS